MDGEELTAPMPPDTFVHNGEAYVLRKSSSVRQSNESIPELTDGEERPENPLRVVSESILDLESQQKSTVCEVGISISDLNICKVRLPR